MNFKEWLKKMSSGIKKLLFGEERPCLREGVSAALFALSLFFLDGGFRFIYRQVNTSPLGGEIPLLFTLLWIGFFVTAAFLLPRLGRRIFQIAITAVFSLFTVVHAFMFSLFGNFFTVASVIFAGEGADFFDWSYFHIPKKFIALVLFCLLLSILSALVLPKRRIGVKRGVIAASAALVILLLLFLVKSVVFAEKEGNITWDGDNGSLTAADVYERFTDTNKCLHMLGLYEYTLRDLSIFTGLDGLFTSVSIGEMDAYFEGKEIDPDNAMTGVFRDKNLILIQLESIDTWMVNEVSMPFYSSLMEKGISFSQFYTPKYLSTAATFNTEMVVNTGLVPPVNATFDHFSKNAYPYSLATLFAEAGYRTESFHRSYGGIYNRSEVHVNLGYEAYRTGADMGMDNPDLDTDLMDGYEMMVKDERFFSFVITYSGHGPYSADSLEVKSYYEKISAAFPDGEEEYLQALCHAYETDCFLRALYEALAADGRLKDTVLVFYSDHYDHYLTDKSLLAKCKGTEDANLMSNVPFLIYCEGMESRKVEKAIASYDVLPTLINLFGLDCDGRYLFGNDAFSENGGYVIFSDGSWYDGETYFNAGTDAPTPLSGERGKEVETRLETSWNLLKVDYFAKKTK